MRKVVIAKDKSGLTSSQVDLGAKYLALTQGRHVKITDLFKAKAIKNPNEIEKMYAQSGYEEKYPEVYENYKKDIEKGMRSRINLFITKDWFSQT
jgi:hypothetical protein